MENDDTQRKIKSPYQADILSEKAREKENFNKIIKYKKKYVDQTLLIKRTINSPYLIEVFPLYSDKNSLCDLFNCCLSVDYSEYTEKFSGLKIVENNNIMKRFEVNSFPTLTLFLQKLGLQYSINYSKKYISEKLDPYEKEEFESIMNLKFDEVFAGDDAIDATVDLCKYLFRYHSKKVVVFLPLNKYTRYLESKENGEMISKLVHTLYNNSKYIEKIIIISEYNEDSPTGLTEPISKILSDMFGVHINREWDIARRIYYDDYDISKLLEKHLGQTKQPPYIEANKFDYFGHYFYEPYYIIKYIESSYKEELDKDGEKFLNDIKSYDQTSQQQTKPMSKRPHFADYNELFRKIDAKLAEKGFNELPNEADDKLAEKGFNELPNEADDKHYGKDIDKLINEIDARLDELDYERRVDSSGKKESKSTFLSNENSNDVEV